MATEIVAMRRVSAYRTTDDKLHSTRDAAVRHQARVDLASWVGNNLPTQEAPEMIDEIVGSMTVSAPELVALLRAASKGGA